MRLLLLLAVATGSAVGGLVGVDHCSWGPKYWCASLPQASSCGAVKHCISSVWEKERVGNDKDEVCDICKEMVGEARDTLQSNETMEELREVFDGSCDLIPLKVIAKECRTLADEFVVELVETLASEMNPDTVCTVAGLCNSARIDAMLEKYYANRGVGSSCRTCRSQVQSVATNFRNTPTNQIEVRLVQLCGYMGSYSDACAQTVVTNIETIVDFLTKELTPEICEVDGICLGDTQALSNSNALNDDDLQCEFCEKVIKHWIDVYASDSYLQEFKQIMDGLCDKLDTKNSAHCKHIVDDYYMPLFEYLRTIDPHSICALVGICGSGDFFEVDNSVPVYVPYQVPQITDMTPLIAAQDNTESSKPGCVLCEYVLHQLQSYIQKGQTEEEIKEYVDAICEKMPSAIKGECKNFVDQYEPLLIQLLVDEMDPSQICTEIKLCEPKAVSGASCETCEYVMEEVFSVITDKDDQDMIRNVLESICYRLPASIDGPCEDFVDKYTPMILNILSSALNADEACALMNLCKDEQPPTPPPVRDSGCILCEYVVSTLDKMIEDKSNEEAIKNALDNVCSYLPDSISGQCKNFVDTYTDLIIDMIAKEATPDEICQELGLCKKPNMFYQPAPVTDLDTKKGPYCTLCEYAITTIDQMLEDKTNQQEIEQALDVVCYQLTAPVHKECLKMVEKYTEEIIDLFVKDYTPSMICSHLALCTNSDISSNDIHALASTDVLSLPLVDDDETQLDGDELSCIVCEFAMEILDEHIDDAPTVDQVERVVQFLCSYLPGSVADRCEEFVDQNGKKIIDALVNKDLSPKEVCTLDLNMCDGSNNQPQPQRKCEFPPELWCSTPFHAKLCDAVEYCQLTAWSVMKTYGNY